MLKFAPWAVSGLMVMCGLVSCAKAPSPVDEPAAPQSPQDLQAQQTPQAQEAVSNDLVLSALIDSALVDPYAYEKLAELCDEVGHRLAASAGMKRAIAWSMQSMRDAGFDSVWTEPVTVPHWTRGNEWARCTTPVEFDLAMTGLGLSDGTGPDGIQAEVMVVKDYDELDSRATEAKGST